MSIPLDTCFDEVSLSFECGLHPPVYHIDLINGREATAQCTDSTSESEDQSVAKPSLLQCHISITELLARTTPLTDSIRLKQEACAYKPTWQHKLLYRPKRYEELQTFYRKIANQFSDSWCPILPILDNAGGGICAMFIPAFHLNAVKVTRADFQKFVLDNGGENAVLKALGTCCAEDLGILHSAPDVGLRKIRTATSCSRRTPFPMQRSQTDVNNSSLATCLDSGHQEQENGSSFNSFFDLETSGRQCRLIVFPLSKTERTRNYQNWFSTIRQAVDSKLAVAMSSHTKIGAPHDCCSEVRKEPCNVMLFFGGKDMLALDWLPAVAKMFHTFATCIGSSDHNGGKSISYNFNTNVVLFEYPGYGFSVGATTPANFRAHVEDVIQRLIATYEPDQELIVTIVGYSLGTGMAIETARYIDSLSGNCELKVSLRDLVVIAALTNVSECTTQIINAPRIMEPLVTKIVDMFNRDDLAWSNYTGLSHLVEQLGQHSWRSDLRIQFIHGSSDRLVKPELGRRLYQYTRQLITSTFPMRDCSTILSRVTFTEIAGANHWSILGEANNLTEVYRSLFKPECIKK